MSSITVLTLVPNAADRLPRCLDSVAWADSIFCVIDTKTTDGSDAIARRYTSQVVYRDYEDAASQRNWAIPQIATEWTLVLDADEWVSPELANRIQDIIQTPGGPDGYMIRRLSYFFGRLIKGCGWQKDYNLRLFRTQKGRYLKRRVHSRVVVDGPVGRIIEPMYHDTYRDYEEYFATFHRFTSWGAMDLLDVGKRANAFDLLVRPITRFLNMYIVRSGFRDGYHGVVLCGLAAFSVFMKYAKLWNLDRLKRGNGKDVPVK